MFRARAAGLLEILNRGLPGLRHGRVGRGRPLQQATGLHDGREVQEVRGSGREHFPNQHEAK